MDKQAFLHTLKSKLVHYGCDDSDLERIYTKIQSQVPESGNMSEMNELLIQVLSAEGHRFEKYDSLAVQFLADQYQESISDNFLDAVKKIQQNRDLNGDPRPLLSKEFYTFICDNAEKVESVFDKVLKTSRSFPLSTFGWKTLFRSYLIRTDKGVIERPDHLWYRVSLFLHRDDWERVESMFRSLRQGEYIHATPTLFSAGMIRPQMASCFPAGTMVLTSRGYKDISKISIGEEVLSHEFKWRKVQQLHQNKRSNREMFRLCVYGKEPIEATADHPFLVYDATRGKFLWKEVEDLRSNDWIAEDDAIKDRHMNRHFFKGILYGTERGGEVRIRASRFERVKKTLDDFHISYEHVNPCIIRLSKLSQWLPVDVIREYSALGREAFCMFLEGIRCTHRYNYMTQEFEFPKEQQEQIECVARIKGMKIAYKNNRFQVYERSGMWSEYWNRKIVGGRKAVRLLSKTLITEPEEDVYTLGVETDHSYIVHGIVVKNCFLMGTEDSVDGIFTTLSDAAQISKWAGGLGIHISNIRGKNSYIYGTNGTSNGILPMLKVFNDTARYIDQCFSGQTSVFSDRGMMPIQDLVAKRDRVLTKNGKMEMVVKKLVYSLPPEDLVQIRVKTPWETNETIIMSRAHTVQWKDSQNETFMVPLHEARYGWMTTYVEIQGPETDFSVEDCVALGYIYRNLFNSGGMRYTLTILQNMTNEQETALYNFLNRYYSGRYRQHEGNILIDLNKKRPNNHIPEPIDFSQLKTFPYFFTVVTPLAKAVAFQDGWNIAGVDNQFLITYRKSSRFHGTIVSVTPYEGKDPVLVYDLEVENDPSYQTSMGIVHNGGGKRNGAFALYLEPWHSDILPFLEAKRNVGPEEDRARDLFYALWMPDLFMKCVEEGKDWYLMSPDKCPGLDDVWGEEFERKYQEYVKKEKYTKKMPARELWKVILRSQIETGTPYLLYKDSCNRKSNQQNLGTIRSSNLCCEIIEYSDHNEYAVCNLASISLASCLIDKQRLKDTNIWVFGREDCMYCKLLKGFLDEGQYDYVYKDKESSMTQEETMRIVTGRTLPIVYINDEYVGGFSETWSRFLRPVFDFEKLGRIVEDLVVNLNIVIDKNAYPMEKCRVSNMKHRPIGIGVQGLADVFSRMLYPYDSPEARTLNREIFECMYYHALKSSNTLAKTNGPYSSFAGSPLSKGQFHFDLSGGKSLVSQKWDWETLRTDIMTHGTRNSLLVAPMPTASTSQILGNTESFEPLTSNLYLRRTGAGEFYVCNQMMRKMFGWLGIWNNDTIDSLIIFKGSVKNLRIPDFLKNVLRTVWEIPQKSLIDMAADRQHFIDQSQSFNIYLQDADMEKLTKIHFYGWKKGLKTGSYYVRSRASISSQNFTVDPLKEKEKICDSCSA